MAGKVRRGGIEQAEAPAPAGMEVPHDRLMAAIINELARSRIRHRALLSVLEEHGLLDVSEYVERYRLEEAEDFRPFVELLLLSPHEFKEHWSDWMIENAQRFGYDGAARMNITLSTAAETPAPVKRPRRRSGSKKD